MRQKNPKHVCPLCGSQLTEAKYHQIVDIQDEKAKAAKDDSRTIKVGKAVINITRDTFLKPTLKKLAKLQIELERKGYAKDGSLVDGDLFEEILAIQDDILNGFGLPISPKYEKLLWFKTQPTDAEINKRVNRLRKAATTYLSGDAKPDLQILKEAQELNQDPFIVLPEIKVPTHIYTLFVYEEILLKRRDNVENILSELKLVSQGDILDPLGLLGMGELKRNKQKVIDSLRKKGMRYLKEFIAQI